MVFDGLDAQRRCHMALAGARTADQHDIVGDVDEVAAMQLTNQSFVDLATGKVEAGQIAIDREARDLELIGHRSNLPFCCLGFEQLGEDRDGGFERRSEEHTSELQSLMRISNDVFCLIKKTQHNTQCIRTSKYKTSAHN